MKTLKNYLSVVAMASVFAVGCKEEKLQKEKAITERTEGLQSLNAPQQFGIQSLPTTYSIMYTPAQITYVKGKIASQTQHWYNAFLQLKAKADGYASRTHNAVANFYVPAYYANTSGHNAAKIPYVGDVDAAYTSALTYLLTANNTYAYKAIYFLKAWSSTNTSISSLHDSPLVSAYGGVGFLVAADILIKTPFWTTAEKTTFKNWVQNVYLPAVYPIRANGNNWGDWGTYAVACSYVILGQETNLLTQIERMKMRIDMTIAPDGHFPNEVDRGVNGPWYTYFALSAMTASAQLALNTTGTNLFTYTSPNGRKLKTAIDYLFYYTKHQEEWPWHPMPPKNLTVGQLQAPVDLFEGVSNAYGSYYNIFTTPYKPIMGGYKGTAITHFAWKFPSLMRTP